MKKLTSILGILLVCNISLMSCGNNQGKNNEASESEGSDLTGKYFVRLDEKHSLYFVNDKEVLSSYADNDARNDYEKNHPYVRTSNLKYTRSGNNINLKFENYSEGELKIYNEKMIVYYFGKNGVASEGVAYKLTSLD